MNGAEKLLTRGVDEIIEKKHFHSALESGKKLRVKFGIDPTAPDLHLGHAVILRKLRQFQDLGHKAVLIIGDFTATIGDPSGRSEERVPLTEKDVMRNMKKYLEQAGKIIDIKKSDIKYNSEWFGEKNSTIIPQVSSVVSVQQTLEREDFKKRIKDGNAISVLEELYPLFQGYDSVAVEADVELGGADQKFNLLMGRRIQRAYKMKEQDVMTMPLLEGTDGVRKMSKSYGNYIALNDKPNDMFGKIMSIPDELMEKYYMLLTDIDFPKDMQFRDAKLKLAKEITASIHGADKAQAAEGEFISVFSKKETPSQMPDVKILSPSITALDLVLEADYAESRSEARRLIIQGGTRLNDKILKDPDEKLTVNGGDVLRAGKKRFTRIKLK